MVSSSSVMPTTTSSPCSDDNDASEKGHQQLQQPSFFTDKYGNLKFVVLVVRYPLFAFLGTLLICVFLTAILAKVVFANGNPVTDDSAIYELNDIRSIAFDSFRLARREIESAAASAAILSEQIVSNASSTSSGSVGAVKPRSLNGDFTYWVFETKSDEQGVFGSPESVRVLKEAEDMFHKSPSFNEWCKLIYDETTGESSCERPLSAMNSYYASSWNSTTAQHIINELHVEENANQYNFIAPCIEYGVACQDIVGFVFPNQLEWAQGLNVDMNSMVQSWDGEGPLNANITEVTLLHAVLNKLPTKAPLVQFFYDKSFSYDHPISRFSRSIVMWGAPLNASEADEIINEDGGQQSSKADTDKRRVYVIDVHLQAMNELSDPNDNSYVYSYYFMGSVIFGVIMDILSKDALRAIASFALVFFYLLVNLGGSWFLASIGMVEIFLSIPLAWFFFSVVLQIEYFAGLNTLCLFIVAAIGADDIFVFWEAYKQSAHKGPHVLRSLESRMSWVYRRAGSGMAITSATTCSAFLCTVFSPLASTRSFGIFACLVIFIDYVLVMILFCTAVVIYHDRFERPGCCCFSGFCSKIDPSPTEKALGDAHNYHDGNNVDSRSTRFFRTFVSDFILKRRNRLLIAAAILGWLSTACYYTAQLKPVQTSEQDLSANHPLQRSVNILRDEFPRAAQDTAARVHFLWGIGDVDRTGVNQLLDPDYLGLATFVDSFSFNEQCQASMLSKCKEMKSDEQLSTFLKTNKDGQNTVRCFIEELLAYAVLGSLDDCDAVKALDYGDADWIPLDQVNSLMTEFLDLSSCYGQGKIRDWYKNDIGFDGEELRFVGLSVDDSILDPWATFPQHTVRRHYDAYKDMGQEMIEMQNACGAKVTFTDSDQKFIAMNNQRLYRETAISGAMLGVAIAFLVLLISTRRLLVSFFATLSILCVLVSVVGATTLSGWSLGTTEAILITLLAGFSVDYVVHLAHAYVCSRADTNEDRIRDAFGDMGLSVLNGMVTSVLASIPLFFCTLIFFQRFGTFLCLTILFSWVFANFGFMSVLAEFGGSACRPRATAAARRWVVASCSK